MRRATRWVGAVAAVLLVPGIAGAQEDSVVVQAGARYEAGGLYRMLLGSGYRELWTAPIRVPRLEPDTAFGGLEFTEPGGGAQTTSAQFRARDGREFVFRSVDKDQSGGLHPDLHGTIAGAVIQDQVSAKHPGGAMVVARLLEAAGVLHATPVLSVMADESMFGEHRSTFAGMLGMLEERPEETATVGQFAEYERIIGSERLLERLEETPEDRPDAEAYLRARLMDLLVGDWDRHPDQWRWAQIDRDGRRYWRAIPRDRDNAFFGLDGAIAMVGAALRPTASAFGPRYADLYPMLHNAQPLDRRILPELERERWAAVAADLQRRLTDEVIADAVAAMPAEYVALNGAELEAGLRARRDALGDAARTMYGLLAETVEVWGTDEPDRAEVTREPDGGVLVRLADADGETYFARRFDPAETREVRVLLRGGDDEARVTGTGPAAMNVRLLGGGSDDRLSDETRGERVFFYDDSDGNTFEPAAGTVVDRREYEEPETATFAENNAPPARDWGSTSSFFSPTADWMSEVGPAIGGGPSWTRYGFRRHPYATRTGLTVLWAPLATRFGVEGEVHRIHTGGGAETRLTARATQLPVVRIYGFGNESAEPVESSRHRVWSNEVAAELDAVRWLGRGVGVHVGALVERVDPEPVDVFPSELVSGPGFRSYGTAGLRLGVTIDRRDHETFPRQGFRLEARGAAFPLVWGDVPEAFTTAAIVGSGYLPVPLPLETTLAVRAGGEAVGGEAPIQRLAFIGGSSSLRGYKTDRFVGDAAAFANAELRTRLAHVDLLVIRGEIGIVGLVDAGRVWWKEERSSRWHSNAGAGLWFGTLDRQLVGHVLWGYGKSHNFSAGLGMPF